MAKKNEYLEHRGRFQAQGSGVEESEFWAQQNPITVSEALKLMRKLISKLTQKDFQRRKESFEKAQNFISEAGRGGGIFARVSKSFRVKGSKDERVDIEVLSGKAFVKDKEND